MVSAPPLVWLAEVPFDGSPHRQQHLARLLRAEYKVLFVEPPPPRRAPRLDLLVRDGLLVAQVAPLTNARPLRRLLSHPSGMRLARLAARLQLRRVLVAAGLASHERGLTVVCSNVFLIEAARALRPALLLTDICDDPRYYPGEPPWTADLLRCAVQTADIVTTSSRALEAEFKALGARRLTYVSNGIHKAFLRMAVASVPRRVPPLLGFVGHLGPWVDFDLLRRLAAELPDCELELVGSVASDSRADLAAVLAYPNARYLPAVPYAEVPGVVARFSVGLIPFRLSRYTRAVNPIKLYEYAALDLPVICTAFSPDVEQLRPEIDVCATAESFIQVARERTAGRGRLHTRHIAESHTWEQIARHLAALLDSARD